MAGAGMAAPLFAKGRVDKSWISVITDECAKTQEDSIRFANQYGLSFIELRGVPGGGGRYDAQPRDFLREARKQFDDAGLRVSFLNTGLLKYKLPGTVPRNPKDARRDTQQRFDHRLDNLKRSIEAAHILGVDKVRVFTFHRVANPLELMPRLAEIIGEMADVAADEKVHLLIENEASTNVATCAELAAFTKLLPSPAIGINWDPLNAVRYHEKPMPDGYEKLPKKRIENVQIKGKSVLTGYHQLLPWAEIFDAMARDGYRGKFGLETHIFGAGQIQASHDSMKEILHIVETS